MTLFFIGSFSGVVLGCMMAFLSLFLVLLVLVQRGRGGGLTGALGGPGGQSAFGSKAGDTFTVITVVVAAIWAFTCAFTMWLLGTHSPTVTTDTNTPSLIGDPGDDIDTDTLTIPAGDSLGLGGPSSGGPEDPEASAPEANIELAPATSDTGSDPEDDGATTTEPAETEADETASQ